MKIRKVSTYYNQVYY